MPKARWRFAVAAVSLSCSAPSPSAQSPLGSPALVVDTIATGLPTPKAIAMTGPKAAIVAYDRFKLARLDLTTGGVQEITGGPPAIVVKSNAAETAIFDIAVAPDFATSGILFMSVAVGVPGRTSVAVMRARVRGDALVDTTTLFVADAWESSEAHYGGSLLLQNGFLFLGLGERESRARVQDLGTHIGKILRIHSDGRVPADNPFVGRADVKPEIWTSGHRNPQGLAVDSTGQLWSNEHGPRHGDELNRLERGADYGWPRTSYGLEYTGGAVGSGFAEDSMTTAPMWVWTPSIAPSDLLIYSGRAIAAWRGNFLTTSLNGRRHLNRVVWDGVRVVGEERLFVNALGRLRSIAEDERGWIYLGNDAGQIIRIRRS